METKPTETFGCCFCVPPSQRYGDEECFPKRKVVKEDVTYTPEATTTYTLSCGHTII